MIGHVYRVRTAPGYDGSLPQKQHYARQGSLVVITYRCQDGVMFGLAPSELNGEQHSYNFRPCDLKKLEFHEEVNQ